MPEATSSTEEEAATSKDEGAQACEGTQEEVREAASGEGEAAGGSRFGANTRETIVELGDRARAVVEDLARHARERREAAEAQARRRSAERPFEPAGSRAGGDADPVLPQQLGALRACIVEVSDVLEATIERLETVEHQLGDPDASIERDLAEGIARCERVLMGIEHRVESSAPRAPMPVHTPVFTQPASDPAARVLVVARSSRRRADLCIAVERQGLHCVAAHDLGTAIRTASRSMPDVALLDLEGSQAERVRALEEWMDYQESGALPRVAVLGVGEAADPESGFEAINEEHGEAAMAAVLAQLARRAREDGNADPDRSRSE